MALYLEVASGPGKTLVATVERLSDGKYWSVTASDWATTPAFADKKITLTENAAAIASENTGSYTATLSHANLGTTGPLRIRYHDDADANDKTIAVDRSKRLVSGSEVDGVAATIDGITLESAYECLLAVLTGVAAVSGNDVTYKKRDGTTTKMTITYTSTDGVRSVSAINS